MRLLTMASPLIFSVSMGCVSQELQGIEILGNYTHDTSLLELTTIGTSSDDLDVPRDLEFHPDHPDQLWVVNRGDDSATIFSNTGEPNQSSDTPVGFERVHFLAQPAALAFGRGPSNSTDSHFATIHETDEMTQGQMTPADFMGPTLWSGDTETFIADHPGHIDMLHNTPLGMGIAWERDTVYWVFDGYHSSITRYNYKDDHDLGGTNHDDGVIRRYAEDEVQREPDIPSHMAFDEATGLLYIADTGNNRIAVLDTETGDEGSAYGPQYDSYASGYQRYMEDADIWTLIDEDSNADLPAPALEHPSGLEINNGMLFVTDNATSTIYAYTMDGDLIDWLVLDVDPGTLMGIAFNEALDLFYVDPIRDEVIRISPK